MQLRDSIFRLVDPRNKESYASRIYDIVMLIAIAISMVPLMFKTHNELFWYFDLISGICFIVIISYAGSLQIIHQKRLNWRHS